MPRILRLAAIATLVAGASALAQRGGPMSDSVRAERWAVENELQSAAIVERKVMIPMRDGIRIPADIYRPKDTSQKISVDLGAHARTTSTSGTCRTASRAT